MLSGSTTGVAKIRDTVTKREIQSLEHTGTYLCLFCDTSFTLVPAVTDRHISVLVRPALSEHEGVFTVFLFTKAYHVLNNGHTVATVDHGEDATIKIWSTQRSSSHTRIPVSWRFEGGGHSKR